MSKYGRVLVLCIIFFLMCNCSSMVYANENIDVQSTEKNDVGTETMQGTLEEVLTTEDMGKCPESIVSIYSSIVVEIIGAFLGFLSAIAFANRSNRKQTKELDSSLYNELKTIYNELKERLTDNDFGDFYRYQTPIWEINLASGALALVANSLVYNKYINIYSKIQYAQTLEMEYLNTKLYAKTDDSSSFAYRYIVTIDKARRREAENICEQIEKSILKEKKKCQEKK